MEEGKMSGILGAGKANKLAFFSLAAAMVFGAPAANADLIGAEVTITGNFPTLADQFTNTLTGTVPVSFPVGSLFR
jgi:hypothetical protein